VSTLGIVLAAASVAATPPSGLQGLETWPFDAPSSCRSSIDPRFVQFVPSAPSSGSNPLFRLIADPAQEMKAALPVGGVNACKADLTRESHRKPF
jgi:hypothetical protein